MKQIKKEVITYELEEGFFVDVEMKPEGFIPEIEVWIYHENFDIKKMMFGVGKIGISEVEKIIEANKDMYMSDYLDLYMRD